MARRNKKSLFELIDGIVSEELRLIAILGLYATISFAVTCVTVTVIQCVTNR